MSIPVDLAYVKRLKDEAARLFPHAKSSHLTEAIAAAFGFNTNAALRAALADGSLDLDLDDYTGNRRLVELGANAGPKNGAFRQASLRLLVTDAMAAIPSLTRFGFGVYDQYRKPPQTIEAEFYAGRAAMLEPRSLDEFDRAYQWLSRIEKTKAMTVKAGSSYGLKHKVEQHWRTQKPDTNGYVSNGLFIAAAHAAGFRIRQIGDSPNAALNISQRSLAAIAGDGDTRLADRKWMVEWSNHRMLRAPGSSAPPADYQRAISATEAEALSLAIRLMNERKRYITVHHADRIVYRLPDIQAIARWWREADMEVDAAE